MGFLRRLLPKPGDKIIVRTEIHHDSYDEIEIEKATCPICGHYEPLQEICTTDGKYEIYNCHECHSVWKVKQ